MTGAGRPGHLAAALAAATYCWWATGLPSFSWVAAAAVAVPAAWLVTATWLWVGVHLFVRRG